MTPARPVRRALATAGCLLALAGCSFQGGIATSSDATSSPSTTAPDTGTGTSSSSPSGPSETPPAGTTPSGTGSSAPSGTTPADGSSAAGSTPAAGGTSTGGGTAPAPTERCHSGDLVGRLATEDSSAGHRHALVELRNISGRSCQVRGYGGVQLIDEYEQDLPTDQERVPAPPPGSVTVAPGGTTTSQLTWAVVPGDADAADGPCQPTPTTLAVIPPNETQPLALAWSLGPVCQGGTLQQQAYR